MRVGCLGKILRTTKRIADVEHSRTLTMLWLRTQKRECLKFDICGVALVKYQRKSMFRGRSRKLKFLAASPTGDNP